MQTRRMSIVETVTSTAIGLVVSLVANHFIFWVMDKPLSVSENIYMTLFFTGVSIIRGYFVRRLFNKMQAKEESVGTL